MRSYFFSVSAYLFCSCNALTDFLDLTWQENAVCEIRRYVSALHRLSPALTSTSGANGDVLRHKGSRCYVPPLLHLLSSRGLHPYFSLCNYRSRTGFRKCACQAGSMELWLGLTDVGNRWPSGRNNTTYQLKVVERTNDLLGYPTDSLLLMCVLGMHIHEM